LPPSRRNLLKIWRLPNARAFLRSRKLPRRPRALWQNLFLKLRQKGARPQQGCRRRRKSLPAILFPIVYRFLSKSDLFPIPQTFDFFEEKPKFGASYS
jgi:hypothetical protein